MSRKNTRRDFLKSATAAPAGAIGFPYFVRASTLGKDGGVAPSNRIVMGCIGTGGQGKGDMSVFMDSNAVQVVAVCDVDADHLNEARDMVNKKYGNKNCEAFKDFRKLLGRKDIDAVTVTTPDHWHGLISAAAANAHKDVYCEKPLVNSIAEGRAVCEAVRKNKRILQTGSQERSGDNSRRACELVRNGRIGKVHTIRINLPCDDDHHKQVREMNKQPQPDMPAPEVLDWDYWLGPAAKVPYTKNRCHFFWRFILAHGGGEMTDRGAHVIDIAQLGNGTDDTGPIEVMAEGKRAEGNGPFDVFWDYHFENIFANGVKMIGEAVGPRGLKFEGDDGWIMIHIHGGRLEASSESLLKEKIKDSEIQLGSSPGHHQNFLDCVASRKDPIATAEIGHRTATICHLNNIAMATGKPLKWDPKAEKITNDADANKLLKPHMRSPWHL